MGRIRWALRIVGVGITLVCVVAAGRFLLPQPGIADQPGSTQRQLAFVRDALDDGADTAAQGMFPEGYVFLNALYGLAWVQAAHTDPDLREPALRESRWALARVESDEGRAVFSPRLAPAYGVFWAGWSNWLRGAILTLDRSDPAEVRAFSDRSAELAQAFTASPTPFLQAYPGQAWPVDSTVAIASLRLHDTLFDARFATVVEQWVGAARAHLDPATGLLPHQVSAADGSPRTGARATSQTVILRFLPEIDPAFARQQYATYRDQFLAYPGGFGPALRSSRTASTGGAISIPARWWRESACPPPWSDSARPGSTATPNSPRRSGPRANYWACRSACPAPSATPSAWYRSVTPSWCGRRPPGC
ncbi:hypothetical protein ACFXK0_14610 [Nocardia sp. NPDC059177]|uniref:hypothetical protein n=1 Tax=Nocardia sp. NPDC059177 TaxID=3346759 RepID=UPI0036CE4336